MSAGFYIAIERNVDVKKIVGIEGKPARLEVQSAATHAFLQRCHAWHHPLRNRDISLCSSHTISA
jgi:hypothetical protein